MPNQSVCFLQEQLNQVGLGARLVAADSTEQDAFYRFAEALGCFAREPYVDENGRATKMVLGQKASTVLRQILADGQAATDPQGSLRIGDFAALFPDLPEHCPPNPRLLDFIGHAARLGKQVQYSWLATVLRLERDSVTPLSGLFQKLVLRFDRAYRLMQAHPDGKQVNGLLVTDGLTRFYHAPSKPPYTGVTHRTKALANLCASYGLNQAIFTRSVAAFDQARARQIPHHILGTPLAEPIGSQDFTFAMLDKRDPENAVLGILCSCCGTVGAPYYGSGVAQMAIYAPDTQNLVVRNRAGTIVAKGTLRILADRAQAVVNTLAVNDRFQHRQHQRDQAAIFAALVRGVQAVVQTYDRAHPQQPLQIVTVGTSCNKLLEQCLRYPYATADEQVAAGPVFRDAEKLGQCVLYRAGGSARESGGSTNLNEKS